MVSKSYSELLALATSAADQLVSELNDINSEFSSESKIDVLKRPSMDGCRAELIKHNLSLLSKRYVVTPSY